VTMGKIVRRIAPFCAVAVMAGVYVSSALAGVAVYNNIPTNPSTSAPSLNYASHFATQFGGAIAPTFGVDGNTIGSATVELANFDFSGFGGDFTGYSVPLTLTLYNIDGTGEPILATPFAQSIFNASINWAPDANGDMQAVTIPIFATNVPSSFIYGLSFAPTGHASNLSFALSGEYNALGNWDPFHQPFDTTSVGQTLAYACASGPPADGPPSTNFCDSSYWDTTVAFSPQTPLGTLGTPGVFSQDTSWVSGGFGTSLIEFDSFSSVPEPATFGLIGFGLMAFAAIARKRTQK
jgi:hypothetical protein